MDNFLGGQAKAIWDALDTMLKEDPQAYRKFISEQLEEGRQMMKKETGAGEENSSSEVSALRQMFSGMNIGKGQQSDKKLSSSGKSGEGDAGPPEAEDGPLLDDEIGKKSILTQIVKGEDDDEENGPKLLSQLKIPQSSSISSNGGPSKIKMSLIEEL